MYFLQCLQKLLSYCFSESDDTVTIKSSSRTNTSTTKTSEVPFDFHDFYKANDSTPSRFKSSENLDEEMTKTTIQEKFLIPLDTTLSSISKSSSKSRLKEGSNYYSFYLDD